MSSGREGIQFVVWRRTKGWRKIEMRPQGTAERSLRGNPGKSEDEHGDKEEGQDRDAHT